jgi:hypothetical protein
MRVILPSIILASVILLTVLVLSVILLSFILLCTILPSAILPSAKLASAKLSSARAWLSTLAYYGICILRICKVVVSNRRLKNFMSLMANYFIVNTWGLYYKTLRCLILRKTDRFLSKLVSFRLPVTIVLLLRVILPSVILQTVLLLSVILKSFILLCTILPSAKLLGYHTSLLWNLYIKNL